MVAQRKRIAPYVPASALSEFFDHIRYVREPAEVDSGLLRDYGFSEANAFALLSTLKFLGLTDEKGKPTSSFRELQTGGDEFRDALRGVVETAYADLFSRLDVSRDTKDKIINFFARNYSPATAEKAARLFLDLCGEAGIPTASQPRKADASAKQRPAKPAKGRAAPSRPVRQQAARHEGEQGQGEARDSYLGSEAGPRIEIRINSQDLVNMQADQIKAIFDGMARLYPQLPTHEMADNGEERLRVDEPVGLTQEAYDLLAHAAQGQSIPMYVTPSLERIANENGVFVTGTMSPTDVLEALRAKG